MLYQAAWLVAQGGIFLNMNTYLSLCILEYCLPLGGNSMPIIVRAKTGIRNRLSFMKVECLKVMITHRAHTFELKSDLTTVKG
jgi:hypothetical protein